MNDSLFYILSAYYKIQIRVFKSVSLASVNLIYIRISYLRLSSLTKLIIFSELIGYRTGTLDIEI